MFNYFAKMIAHPYLPIVAMGIISLLFMISFINAASTWLSDWQIGHHFVHSLPINRTLLNHADLINALPAKHLFGESLMAMDDAPITTLQLHLMGISKSMNDASATISTALIAMGDKTGKLYSVGDNLSYGVKIIAITDNAVMLQSAGHVEKLPLARNGLMFKPQASLELE